MHNDRQLKVTLNAYSVGPTVQNLQNQQIFNILEPGSWAFIKELVLFLFRVYGNITLGGGRVSIHDGGRVNTFILKMKVWALNSFSLFHFNPVHWSTYLRWKVM